jgi:hypothetical protein
MGATQMKQQNNNHANKCKHDKKEPQLPPWRLLIFGMFLKYFDNFLIILY